jgi:hypothetical protein
MFFGMEKQTSSCLINNTQKPAVPKPCPEKAFIPVFLTH